MNSDCRVTFEIMDEEKMNGGTEVSGISTLSECKALCTSDTRCVAVSWYDDGYTTHCYYHDEKLVDQYVAGYTTYTVLSRFCPNL